MDRSIKGIDCNLVLIRRKEVKLLSDGCKRPHELSSARI
jgi:hypothetical protein